MKQAWFALAAIAVLGGLFLAPLPLTKQKSVSCTNNYGFRHDGTCATGRTIVTTTYWFNR